MTRPLLLTLLLLLGLAGHSAAQRPHDTTLLVGFGGVEQESSVGPGYHLNLRHTFFRRDSLAIPLSRIRPRWVIPRLEFQAELFAQAGRSGTDVDFCHTQPTVCSLGADPVQTLGLGLLSRIDGPARGSVLLYFIPATVGIYLRRYTAFERPIGSRTEASDEHLRLAGGIGNGFGLLFRIADVTLAAELRAIIMEDLGGTRGGSVPVSIGIVW